MEKQLENQTNTPNASGNLLDALSVIGVIGGAAASLVCQQVAFAVIPLSASVALNILNRRRLIDEIAQHSQSVIAPVSQSVQNSQTEIAHLSQNLAQHRSDSQAEVRTLSEQLTTLSEQLTQVQQSAIAQLNDQSQTQQASFEILADQLKGLQALIGNLTQDMQALNDFTQVLEAQQKQLAGTVEQIEEVADSAQKMCANPNSAEFYCQRAVTQEHSGNKQGAVQDYTEAIRIEPSHASAYYTRGVLRSELGEKKGAVDDLRKAAMLYFEQGDIDHYEQARDLSKEIHALGTSAHDASDNSLLVADLFS
jgi:tetratricopeptide (TPR) repeat protein